MSQRFLLMETKSTLVDLWETQSLTPVTVGSTSLEMQTGPVSLMDSGQGLSQSVIVCSMLQCNVWRDFIILTM